MDAATNMSSTEDDESGQGEGSIANLANRRLLAIVGDMRLESHQRTEGLERIYQALRAMPNAAPPAFAPMLLEEEERHLKKSGETLEKLRDFVEGR